MLLLFLLPSVQATLPVIPYVSHTRQLSKEMEQQLLENNLYGEISGYVIPVSHYAKGMVRFDLSKWMDGTVFDQFSHPLRTKFHSEMNTSRIVAEELAVLHNILREKIQFQRDLLVKQVTQDLQKYATVSSERTSRRPRHGPVFVVAKDLLLSALDYIANFFWERKTQNEQVAYHNKTSRFLREKLFRTEVALLIAHAREQLVQNFHEILKELLHESRLHASLYSTEEGFLQEAIQRFLGSYFADSVFNRYGEKAIHMIQAKVFSVDVKRKHVDVELTIPVALVHETRQLVHIVDLGTFTGSSFNFHQLPSVVVDKDAYVLNWRAVYGPCLPIGSVSVCENVLEQEKSCGLNRRHRTGCRRQNFRAESEFSLIRRMSQTLVVSTNLKQATRRIGEVDTTETVQLEAPVFVVKLTGDDELEIGNHVLTSSSEYGDFSIRYGVQNTTDILKTDQTEQVPLALTAKPVKEIPWISIWTAAIGFLFVLTLLFNCYLLRKVRALSNVADRESSKTVQ